MRFGLPQPVGRGADLFSDGVQRAAGLPMAPLHQHQNNAMSNDQNDKQSTESGGADGKPAVMRRLFSCLCRWSGSLADCPADAWGGGRFVFECPTCGRTIGSKGFPRSEFSSDAA